MKDYILLPIFVLLLMISCKDNTPNNNNSLNCMEYWSAVNFSNFCGLTMNDFDFNTIPADICNADIKSSFSFDDLIYIRVYNHFSTDEAQELYDIDEADAQSMNGYASINNLGDNAYVVSTTEFGQLDHAIVQSVKDSYTVILEVNGNASNSANNCFDANSVIEFAKALVSPL